MSKINLTAIAIMKYLKGKGEMKPIYGVKDFLSLQQLVQQQVLPVIFGGIPLPAGVVGPRTGITFLYGFGDALEELQRRKFDAKQNNNLDYQGIATMEVGKIIVGNTTPQNLPKVRFFNVKRISKELEIEILDRYRAYLRKDKLDLEITKIDHIGLRPDLLDRLVKEPMFSHVEMIIYPIIENLKARQVATVFSTRHIEPAYEFSLKAALETEGLSPEIESVTREELKMVRSLQRDGYVVLQTRNSHDKRLLLVLERYGE